MTEPSIGRVVDNIVGHVEWTLRNEDGSIAEQGSGKNVFTRWGKRCLASGMFPTKLFILADERDTDPLWGNHFMADLLTPTFVKVNEFANDVSTLTRTFTSVFGLPSATRTIRKLALGYSNAVDIGNGSGTMLATHIVLTTPIVQATSQTFEVAYRLTIVLGSQTKGLRRWNTFRPSDERFLAERYIAGTSTDQNNHHLGHMVFGQRFFVDQDAKYVGGDGYPAIDAALTMTSSTWYGGTMQRSVSKSIGATPANNDLRQGAWGFISSQRTQSTQDAPLHGATINQTFGWSIFATGEGVLTPVFKHPAGQDHYFNVIASVALSQGTVEFDGPFRPDDPNVPWHRGYQIRIIDAGDTDPGTEGTYIFGCNPVWSYTFFSWYFLHDTSWRPSTPLARTIDIASGESLGAPPPELVWDGVDTYWSAANATGTDNRLRRWRAGTNEQHFLTVVADTTRYYGFDSPQASSGSYSLASDGAGLVFMIESNATIALQKLFVIDNTKPGRFYQRPSGNVLTANPQTFTVDAADEIHGMAPFVVGDVGKKIRMVDTVSNGSDVVRTITGFNSGSSVDLDGAAFVTESGMLWHWVTVEKRSTGAFASPVTNNSEYDIVNDRLWVFTAAGLQVSLDKGLTWSAVINDLNGLSTSLAQTVLTRDGQVRNRTSFVGSDGALYWIDSNNAINKYVGAGPGGVHTRLTQAALPGFANGFTKGTLSTMIWEQDACDVVDGQGAVWIGQDVAFGRGLWRIPLNNFTVGGAVALDWYTMGAATENDYLDYSFQRGFSVPGGGVIIWNDVRGKPVLAQWDTGVLEYVRVSTNVSATVGSNTGPIHVRHDDGGAGLLYSPPYLGSGTNGRWGPAGRSLYRYDDVASVWRRFNGSAAQFDARYGTTNGGARKLHTTFEKLRDNVKVRFIQSGPAAPVDEFVADERFTCWGAFGTYRTNVDAVDWSASVTMAPSDFKWGEALKIATQPPKLRVAFQNGGGDALDRPLFAGASHIPELLLAGSSAGWLPNLVSLYQLAGDVPETTSNFASTVMAVGIDLNADAGVVPLISKVHFNFLTSDYLRMSHLRGVDRYRIRLYSSDDNVVWAEETAVRYKGNGPGSPPDPSYRYVSVLHVPYGGSAGVNGGDTAFANARWLITFDLEAAGLTVPQRTRRYWKIYLITDNGSQTGFTIFAGIWASDAAGQPVGFDDNNRFSMALDPDLAGYRVEDADWIQDRTGIAGKTGVNTVDDGDGDGFTDTVTINSGTFDTGVISDLTDFLAWHEPGAPPDEFYRVGAERSGPWQSPGARSSGRIKTVSPTQIVLTSRIIPDNLANADWEVRRPATIGSPFPTGPGVISTDGSMGYIQYHPADVALAREVRFGRILITRAAL